MQPTLHQEVFGLLHACVLHAIKRHASIHGAPASLEAAKKVVHDARTMAQAAVEAWWRRLRRDGRGAQFTRAWVDMGFADANGGGNNVPVLTMLHEHVNTPQEHAHVCTIDMYTDGGGATDEWRHTAGWGCAVVHNAHGHITTHLHLGQLRLDEHRAVEERGSTNNDAELRGLLAPAREASKLAQAFTANAVNTCSVKPSITIHTDSTYAILRAVGPTAKKKRHRDVTRMIRSALACARAALGPGNVILRKVRGHSGHAGNDVADALATEGRAGHAMPSAALILKAKQAFGG